MKNKDVIQGIRERGYKITPQRRAIIDALLYPGKPQTAKEVLFRVRESFPEISQDTVYRNLNFLSEIGFLSQINLKSSETSRYEMVSKHHHHLICLGCGETLCLDHCPLDQNGLYAVTEKGYKIAGHAFEVYGYCPLCRDSF